MTTNRSTDVLGQLQAEDENAEMEDDDDVMDQLEEVGYQQRKEI